MGVARKGKREKETKKITAKGKRKFGSEVHGVTQIVLDDLP
jgi:hypothetical protein